MSANDKTIKLWKVQERRLDGVLDTNTERRRAGHLSSGGLVVPRVVRRGRAMAATPARCYANAHAYHINSVSVNSDGEHFASADDLRVNLWNLEVNDHAFNVVDLKPANMEDLTEVITSAAFHPVDCAVLLYASSKGTIKLFDLRQNARCESHAKLLEDADGAEDAAAKSFFSEIVSSISDARFSPDGKYVVSRDFLSVKVWDTAMEARPLKTILVHDHLRPRLCDLYESDCIFDKFEVAPGPNADAVFTGSYSDLAHVFDSSDASLEIDLDLAANGAANPASSNLRADAGGALCPTSGPSPPNTWRRHLAGVSHAVASDPNLMPLSRSAPPRDAPDAVDYRRRVLHVAAHPKEETFAVAGLDRAYLFNLHRNAAAPDAIDDPQTP